MLSTNMKLQIIDQNLQLGGMFDSSDLLKLGRETMQNPQVVHQLHSPQMLQVYTTCGVLYMFSLLYNLLPFLNKSHLVLHLIA